MPAAFRLLPTFAPSHTVVHRPRLGPRDALVSANLQQVPQERPRVQHPRAAQQEARPGRPALAALALRWLGLSSLQACEPLSRQWKRSQGGSTCAFRSATARASS